jgi:hypothetical protein
MAELVRAAGEDDEPRMWAALTRSSHRLLGPTLADFRGGGARGLRASLAPFDRGSFRVVVNAGIDLELGVVAIAGRRAFAGRSAYGAFAAPLRLERGEWKVQIDPSLTIEAVRPLDAERVQERTQLFAEVAAPGRIDEAGMWFDGWPFSARGYTSKDRKHMSIWGEAPQPLGKGRHTVVAFAASGTDAAATAWAFTVTVPGHGTNSPVG